MILLPQKYTVNFDGIERNIFFNIETIYRIEEKIDKPIAEILSEIVKDSSYKNACIVLTELFNNDTDIYNEENNDKRKHIDEKYIAKKCSFAVLGKLCALAFKAFYDTLPENDDPNAQSGNLKR